MLLNEKMGGMIHIALGDFYLESGSTDKSAIRWDVLKDMKKDGETYADSQLFYKKRQIPNMMVIHAIFHIYIAIRFLSLVSLSILSSKWLVERAPNVIGRTPNTNTVTCDIK